MRFCAVSTQDSIFLLAPHGCLQHLLLQRLLFLMFLLSFTNSFMFDTAILTLVKNIKVKQKCLMNNLSINNEVTEKHVLHHMLAIGSIHY